MSSPQGLAVGSDPGPKRISGAGSVLLRADTASGHIVLGEGIAATEVGTALGHARARRAILVSEPVAWAAAGEAIAERLSADGWSVAQVMLPEGEDAKRLGVVEEAARQLAGIRAERDEPLVAIGGGALGDAAGFLAATWLRGVPLIHVPTTLVAQIDSSIGGKTGSTCRRARISSARSTSRQPSSSTSPSSAPCRSGRGGRHSAKR